MDVRGVEITNQLRSAIRAKLLELGVRYDDELPDYILVMVVNKKSRQQMNEDLNLFLEDSTELFVNWLHDQVLKKLQKVTIAKKKSNKDIPTAAVKQEEDKKVKVEDHFDSTENKTSEIDTKKDRDREFEELVGDLAMLNDDDSKNLPELDSDEDKNQRLKSSTQMSEFEFNENKSQKLGFTLPTIQPSSIEKEISLTPERADDTQIFKQAFYDNDSSSEREIQSHKNSKTSPKFETEENKIKLNVNKPKITSVIAVKTKLDAISPSKRFDFQNSLNKTSSSQDKSEDRKRKRSDELRIEQKKGDRLQHISMNEKSTRSRDSNDKVRLNSTVGSIKSRLGISNTHKLEKSSLISSSFTKVSKPRVSNVKSRLGVRKKLESKGLQDIQLRLAHIAQAGKNFREEDDDDAESVVNTSLRSQVIAVQSSRARKSKQKSSKHLVLADSAGTEKAKEETEEDVNEEDNEQCKVPSKVIVTPRPLKPLQPSHKRATQSLLLRAVAEANKSVVMQKKIDPCLKEQKPEKKIKVTRDPKKGKILAVHLNAKKRLVMGKIQIELVNKTLNDAQQAQSSKAVKDDSLDVVKSLFQRSDDKQKFLVTLNGYNNNVPHGRTSEDEEHIDTEVNEEDELNFTDPLYDSYMENDDVVDDDNQYQHNYHNIYEHEDYIEADYQEQNSKVNDNSNVENFDYEENSKKRRKLSPIVYNRSRSISPENEPSLASTVSSVLRNDKKPLVSSVITTLPDKSSEKCRYWPNCTLGIKCAYYHPEVLCSSFPACKFGEKCAYKHPKCKFGSACTKLGCIFSHPPMQCKYHPYCMKPGCPFSHPKTDNSLSPLSPLPPDISSVRAKFTWKKKD